jgi:hypothetical protein
MAGLTEGQEKYLWELSITPFLGVLHRSYKKSLQWIDPRELFCMAKSNRSDFPKVSFTLDGI